MKFIKIVGSFSEMRLRRFFFFFEVNMENKFNFVPKDRMSTDILCRKYYQLYPIVQNAILFHANNSIKNFKIYGIKNIEKI